LLNTGRMRDQWHTMTRTGLSPRLGSHAAEPCLTVHPADAKAARLKDGGLVEITSAHGSACLRVVLSGMQTPGSVFVPIHWNDETASQARIGALVHPFNDPFSGQPDAKATPVALKPIRKERAGFILARRRFALPRDIYWAWEAVPGGYAARVDLDGSEERLLHALQNYADGAEMIRFADPARGLFRTAFVRAERLEAALFLAPLSEGSAVPRWTLLQQVWSQAKLDTGTRKRMLSGKSMDGAADEGPTICACFGVPHARILAAIESGAADIAAIGRALKAGTNCGSCIPELKRLLVERSKAASGNAERASLTAA
jgi:assimilatory nitrate reductase catalytic subunit